VDRIFFVSRVMNDIGPIVNVIPFQLVDCYMTELRRIDIDYTGSLYFQDLMVNYFD
jgi:glucosamine 6-phosphate synthetase-like amidotransferase/phosphosugar isomerase protein